MHENVQHVALAIHCMPQIVFLVLDFEFHFIQLPLITKKRSLTANLIGVALSKLLTPLPYRLLGDANPPLLASSSRCLDSSTR